MNLWHIQGRQLRLKEQYEQATQEGKDGKEFHVNDANVDPEKIKHIKDIFEMGGSEEKTSANKTSSEHLVDPEKLKQLKGMFESGGEIFGEKHERHEEVILGGKYYTLWNNSNVFFLNNTFKLVLFSCYQRGPQYL